ncbi:peroxisome proliferator-activated receptor delta-like [Diadema antillarum]|uniref:peroxisome proliferator-activated receptor delta-like n=1 Tax=Diadema antillarum TaxID=105358 RepID=UPI003A8C2D05
MSRFAIELKMDETNESQMDVCTSSQPDAVSATLEFPSITEESVDNCSRNDIEPDSSAQNGQSCSPTMETETTTKKRARKKKDSDKGDGPVYSDIIRCQICGDKASGMHYGVYSCEGCKGFFRRTQRLKIEYKPCPYWGQDDGCIINIESRNKCQYCRYHKCLALGMSSGAVRMGRVPKVEVQKLKDELDQKEHIPDESEEDRQHRLFVDRLADEFNNLVLVSQKADRDKFWQRCTRPFKGYMPEGTFVVNGMQLDLAAPPREITNRAEMAHMCFTNMEITIEKFATFAKQRDVFRQLRSADQLTLFKGAALEVCAALCSGRYYHGVFRFPEINTYMRRDVAENSPFGDLTTYKAEFMFYEIFNDLRMTEREIAIYCTFLLYSADREGLIEKETVERHQEKLANLLYRELRRNHPERHNLFSKVMDVTVHLRSLVPDHVERLKHIKVCCHGHLPADISPLLGEVYGRPILLPDDDQERA